MDFWTVFAGIAWVFGIGLIAWVAFYAIVSTKRHDLEVAADLEYEEMEAQRRLLSESTVSFTRRNVLTSEMEQKRRNRLSTDAGREILRLESRGRLVFILGAFVGVVVLIVYMKVN